MTERMQCKTVDCTGQILPSTAERTGGYCMPCIQKKERAERQKYIEENRRDIDPFDGVTDPVEIILLHHVRRSPEPLVKYLPFKGELEEVYKTLSEFDEARLIDFSIKKAEKGELEYIENICLELTAFREPNFSKLHKYMLREKIYYPSMLFRNASKEVGKELILRLGLEPDNINLLLLSLAWIENDDVLKEFASWKIKLPDWSTQLYIHPSDYSKEAGWITSANEEKQTLYFDKCLPILSNKPNESVKNIGSLTESDSRCEWCGQRLTNLLEIDISNNVFDFLGFKGSKVKLATCEVCSCYSNGLFIDFDTSGNVAWSRYNKKPEYLPDDSDERERLPKKCLEVSSSFRSPYYAANEFLPTTFSQIGGMPAWIQDFVYPDCPECTGTMKFIAQISNDEIEKYREGMYYVHICSSCMIASTSYQQT